MRAIVLGCLLLCALRAADDPCRVLDHIMDGETAMDKVRAAVSVMHMAINNPDQVQREENWPDITDVGYIMRFADELRGVRSLIVGDPEFLSGETRKKALMDINALVSTWNGLSIQALMNVVEARDARGASPYCRNLAAFEDIWERPISQKEARLVVDFARRTAVLTDVSQMQAFVESCCTGGQETVTGRFQQLQGRAETWVRWVADVQTQRVQFRFYPPEYIQVLPKPDEGQLPYFEYVILYFGRPDALTVGSYRWLRAAKIPPGK